MEYVVALLRAGSDVDLKSPVIQLKSTSRMINLISCDTMNSREVSVPYDLQ
jgi:hypothetical protein